MAVSLRFHVPALLAAVAAVLALGVSVAPLAASATATATATTATATTATATDSAPTPAHTPPDVDVAAYVIADYDTGQILAERAPHRALYPASTLKVLTAATLIPRLSPTLAVTPSAADFAAEPDGSVVGMTAGVTYTVADLWRATFLDSANDAVAELAHLSGGLDATVSLMQHKARALGAYDTVVADADGYDADGQVTSAYDLALLARAGLRIPAFRAYCALRQAGFPGPDGKTIALKSHDPMLLSYPGMIGIKGGITTKAGHTYVGAATRDGHTVIETLMLGGTDIFDQAAKLMDWGLAADGRVAPVDKLGGGSATGSSSSSPSPARPTSASPTPSPSPTIAPPSSSPSTPTPSQPSKQLSTTPATATGSGGAGPTPSPTPPSSSPPSSTPTESHRSASIAGTGIPKSAEPSSRAMWCGALAAGSVAAIPIGVLGTHRRRRGSPDKR
ncbi:MAG: D-alanyl-D-alanine carboxypeptidase family protein [Catenulispora sp.]